MPEITRLDMVTLPPFQRLSWSSDAARAVWEPRVRHLRDLSLALALHLPGSGALPVVPLRLRPAEYHTLWTTAARRDLRVREVPFATGLLPWQIASPQREPGDLKTAIIGQGSAVEEFLAAGLEAQQRMLRLPPCCAAVRWDTWQDYWWPVTARTVPALSTTLTAPPEATRALLLHALRIPTLWYLPCQLICAGAQTGMELIPAALADLGEHEAAAWWADLAHWPVAWSGLHGIAEIKTPVFKLMGNTDPTAEKLTVQLESEWAVEAGARGLHFPYAQVAKRAH